MTSRATKAISERSAETEPLVERAIAWLKAAPERRTIADVGTGSGCISVAIANSIRDAKIFATDISRPALDVARRNARRHKVERRIDFIQCDLLPPHPDPLPEGEGIYGFWILQEPLLKFNSKLES